MVFPDLFFSDKHFVNFSPEIITSILFENRKGKACVKDFRNNPQFRILRLEDSLKMLK